MRGNMTMTSVRSRSMRNASYGPTKGQSTMSRTRGQSTMVSQSSRRESRARQRVGRAKSRMTGRSYTRPAYDTVKTSSRSRQPVINIHVQQIAQKKSVRSTGRRQGGFSSSIGPRSIGGNAINGRSNVGGDFRGNKIAGGRGNVGGDYYRSNVNIRAGGNVINGNNNVGGHVMKGNVGGNRISGDGNVGGKNVEANGSINHGNKRIGHVGGNYG